MMQMLRYFLICSCLPSVTWGEMKNVKATVEVSDARFCGNMGVLEAHDKDNVHNGRRYS